MHVSQQVIQYLVKTAIHEGKKEAHKWVVSQLKKYGNDAMKVAKELGSDAVKGLQRALEKRQGHSRDEEHEQRRGIGPMNCGWSAEHDMSQCIHSKHNPIFSQDASLSNMTGHSEGGQGLTGGAKRKAEAGPDEYGGLEEGGETQTKPYKHIWKRFPNEETAELKWLLTYFIQNESTLVGHEIAFGNENSVANADLTGSAVTAINVSTAGINLAGSDATTTANSWDFNQPYVIQLRMTSPYNILTEVSTMNSGNTVSQPLWLEFFDSKYQYYHVLETKWKIHFNFGAPNKTDAAVAERQNIGFYIFWRYTMEDNPPTQCQIIPNKTIQKASIATANTITTGSYMGQDTIATTDVGAVGTITKNLTSSDYLRMGGWHHEHFYYDTIHGTRKTIHGSYKFGQSKMDVKTISSSDAHSLATTAEGWGKVGSTMPMPENLSVIICYDDATIGQSGVVNVPAGVHLETDQIIQFRDLRANYKFPTPALSNNEGASNMVTDEAFFWRGAAYS